MRSNADWLLVQALVGEGMNDCAIERQTGIPRTTVRDWRRGTGKARVLGPTCPRCGAAVHQFSALPADAYCYLLGQYLGDGHVAMHRNKTPRLRIFMDLLHMNLAERCREAVRTVIPGTHVAFETARVDRLLVLSSYSRRWPCLLPQCGSGPKHRRLIALSPWQRTLVAQEPAQLVRGLIHSDGWRGTNNVRSGGRRYSYPRYQFSQVSLDIQGLFTDALDLLGVSWRQMGPRNISVARAADVARLDAFIEPKS